MLPIVAAMPGAKEVFQTWCVERKGTGCKDSRVVLVSRPGEQFAPRDASRHDVINVTFNGSEISWPKRLHAPWLYMFVNDTRSVLLVRSVYSRQPVRLRDFHWVRQRLIGLAEFEEVLLPEGALVFQPAFSGEYEISFVRTSSPRIPN